MEKLTEAGRLYLNDYYVLEEARNDLFVFLNYITDQVYDKWLEQKNKKELFNNVKELSWGSWKSKGNPGNIQFEPKATAEKGYGLYEAGESGIVLAYGDIRHRSELYDPSSVQLHISAVNNIRKKLNQISAEKMEQAMKELSKYNIDLDISKRAIYQTFVKINPADPETTIDEITEIIAEKCQGIEVLIKHCS